MDFPKQGAPGPQQSGASKIECDFIEGRIPVLALEAPLHKYPGNGFPLLQELAKEEVHDFLQALDSSLNPIETVQRKIQGLEAGFHLSFREGIPHFEADEDDEEAFFQAGIYFNVSMSDPMPLRSFLEIPTLPEKFRSWETDPQVEIELNYFLQSRAGYVHSLLYLNSIYAALQNGSKTISDFLEPELASDDDAGISLVKHPYHTSHIAVMHALGIDRFIIERWCSETDSVSNLTRAADILSAVTGIDSKIIRPILREIGTGGKNDPLRTANNQDHVDEVMRKLKLRK